MKTLFLVSLCLFVTGCASSGDLAKLQEDQAALTAKVNSLTVSNKQCDKKLDNFFKKVMKK
jgi:outer membrane lipoprotein-sorting protein